MTKADRIAIMMRDSGYSKQTIREVSGSSMSRVERIERRQRIPINRGLVTNMLLEAYEVAESANEITTVARELGKLHGLYEPEKTVTINGTFQEKEKQIKQLTTEDLLRILQDDNEDTCVVEGEIV